MKAREVNAKLEAAGAVVVRQRGSHRLYRLGDCVTVVAQHAGRDIPTGTLRKIERDLEPCLGKGWLR